MTARRPDAQTLLLLAAAPAFVLLGMMVSTLSSEFGPGKVLWLIAASLGGMLAVANLRLAVAVMVLAVGFPMGTQIAFGLAIQTIHPLLIVVVATGFLQVALGAQRPDPVLARAGLVMVVSSALGAFAGPDLDGSLFRELNGFVLPLLAAIVFAFVLDPNRDLGTLIVLSAVTLSGASLVALGQKAGVVPEALAPGFGNERVNGMFYHPNILAGFLMADLALVMGAAVCAWRKLPFGLPLVVVSLGLGFAGLFTTQSRGALLGLAAGLLAMIAVLTIRRRGMALLVIALAIAGTAVAVVPRVPESQRAEFAERFQKLNQPGAESGRRLVYGAAVDEIKAHPITGVGTMTFREIINSQSTVPGLERGLGHSHSIVFESVLSLGLAGALAFFYLWFSAMQRFWRATRTAASDDPLVVGWSVGGIGALTALFVQNTTDMVFWQVEMLVLLFFIIASAFAIDRRHEHRG